MEARPVRVVEGGKQEALRQISSQRPPFKEPQLNPAQTRVNVENMSGERPT